MRVARYIKRKLSPYRRWLHIARISQRLGDWTRAAEALGHAERLRSSPALTVQLGHALKESGATGEAVAAYRRAAAGLPRDLDVREHLAFVLRHDGQIAQAAEVYAEMLTIDPRCLLAQRALAEFGQRRLLPALTMSRALLGEREDRLGLALGKLQDEWSVSLVTSVFSPTQYDLFRSTFPTPPPPGSGPAGLDVATLVLCQGAIAADIRATVDSITHAANGRSHVLLLLDAGEEIGERVLALPSAARIQGVHSWAEAAEALDAACSLVVTRAGAVLDPQAMSWLAFTARRTNADAIYGDHDFRIDSVPLGGWLAAPCFFGVHDPVMIAHQPSAPLLVWIKADAIPAAMTGINEQASPEEAFRTILTTKMAVTHVPRVLASYHCRSLPSLAIAAPDRRPPGPAASTPSGPSGIVAPPDRLATITVIVPTRDQATMLGRCIASLGGAAAHPARVRFVVVDNRSVEAETPDTLSRLRKSGVAVVTLDQPFNWSAINNVAAMQSRDDILVFANNDIEALVDGWDLVLERALAGEKVGAVGARLLYPDGSYQHAGITFGIAKRALSAHEGVGADGSAAGPGGRWITRHAVAAVTGAFLATRRTTFESVGGFEERLAIAYNDLDFCFRIRAAGLEVIYEPALTILHHESKTRGYNVSPAQIEWDLREQSVFVEKWGTAAHWDPGYNPQWALEGMPFDGYREPTVAEVLRHIDCQARCEPWLIPSRSGMN